MPSLLSGSRINSSSPGGYANLSQVQYQLGPTPTTSTGYTLITNSLSQATFVSSLGNLQFNHGSVYSNTVDQNINFIGTGTGTVIVSGPMTNTGTNTGVLVIHGGIGIQQGFYTGQDVHINGLQVGRGYSTPGLNNIAITAPAIYSPGRTDGENSIVIGYSALEGISLTNNTIAIGRYALSNGTGISDTVALGDSALMKSGTIPSFFVGYINNIQTGTTTTVTLINHGLHTGTEIQINLVQGTTELNGNNYVVNVVSTDAFELFDTTFSTHIPTFDHYTSSGTVIRLTQSASNIGVGSNAGKEFYDGKQNMFLGYNSAPMFTTGSYNLFMGYDVSNNMTNGNNNISIFGKNMIDGADNQINIGSVFYYNGFGYTTLYSDFGVGLGDDAVSISTGAFNVLGGVGISESLYVGNVLNVTGPGSVTLSPVGASVIMTPSLGGNVQIYPTTSGSMDNMIIGNTNPEAAYFTTVSASSATITSNFASSSTTTGALTVAGGVGVQGSIYSADGNPLENYKLYTPKVTVTNTGLPPANPNIGDFWIDTVASGQLQFIQDGTSTFWIQITAF